jgi:hypothetical protein
MTVSAPRRPAPVAAPVAAPGPLVYVAGHGHRIELRLAAVLEEMGLRTHVSTADSPFALDDDAERALGEASAVLCHVVSGCDLPVEIALAAVRGIPVIAVLPEGAEPDGLAAEVLESADAQRVRYSGVEPQHLLRGALAGLDQ